jgi:hypothetical protein
MNKTPNMLIGFDPAERRHAAQPDAVFHDPEQFSIRVA